MATGADISYRFYDHVKDLLLRDFHVYYRLQHVAFEHYQFSDEVDLDYDSKSKSRKEQALLRLHLTQGKDEAKCTICGDVYPTDFLIAAHIKPRLLCEKSEKLDFDNIAALMCKTGSDDLFEKGYIIICDGIVIDNSKQKKTTPMLKNLIDQLAGKKVSNWVGSFKYYIAHKEYHNGKSKKSAK